MIIYKVTNKINGKYYIGKDKYNNDAYFGSGKLIQQVIKKYGKQNFVKEILCHCKTEEELYIKEAKFVNSDVVNDYMSYNLMIGGNGGDTYSYRNETERFEYHKNMSAAISGSKHPFYGKKHKKESCKKVSDSLKKYYNEIGCSSLTKVNLSSSTKESWKKRKKI